MFVVIINAVGNNDNLNGKNPLIDFANVNKNHILIVDNFKKNPVVNESELLTYMYTLHEYKDLVFYLWSDILGGNRMIVCVHRGAIQSKVIACVMIKHEKYENNEFVFRIDQTDNATTSDKELLMELDSYIEKFM